VKERAYTHHHICAHSMKRNSLLLLLFLRCILFLYKIICVCKFVQAKFSFFRSPPLPLIRLRSLVALTRTHTPTTPTEYNFSVLSSSSFNITRPC
jgi:hypothetical protein